jgi:hypothetical protein
VRLVLYTVSGDAKTLRRAPALQAAARYAEIHIIDMGSRMEANFGERGGGTAMKECHNFGLALAYEMDAGFVPLCADEVAGNTVGTTIVAACAAGYRAVLHLGYRLQPELRARVANYYLAGGIIDVSPVELSRWHLGLMRGAMPPPDGEGWTLSRSTASLDAYGSQGFHLRTLFVYPDVPDGPVRCEGGADQDLARRALSSLEQVKLVTSSAELMMSGIETSNTSENPWRDPDREETDEERMVRAMHDYGDEWNRHWLETTFWTESVAGNSIEKTAAEALQAAVVVRLRAAYVAKWGEN